MSLSVQRISLKVPNSDELLTTLRDGLAQNFEHVEVELVDCPDLRSAPYNLAAEGLSGSTRISDVGGIPNLMPLVNKSKNYKFEELAKLMDLPNAFMVGAGAGPHHIVGTNSEMMPNLVTGDEAVNGSKICKMDGDAYTLQSLTADQTECSLMCNIFASEGKPGKVVRVRASKRTGTDDFVGCMRNSLEKKFGTEPVGLGGFFRLTSGAVKCHVMPAFTTTPLHTAPQINQWLRFFDMPAPMTFFSVLVSCDPGLDLRLEHSHGYGPGSGGHYHYDVTPAEVAYEGYYNVAELLYRIDRTAEPYVSKQ